MFDSLLAKDFVYSCDSVLFADASDFFYSKYILREVVNRIRGGADGVAVDIFDDGVVISSTVNGLFPNVLRLNFKGTFDFESFVDLQVEDIRTVVVFNSRDRIVLRTQKSFNQVIESLASLGGGSQFRNSHGVLYLTAKDKVMCDTLASVFIESLFVSDRVCFLELREDSYECRIDGHVDVFHSAKEALIFIVRSGVRQVYMKGESSDIVIQTAGDISCEGIFVICSVSQSSSLHLFARLLRSGCSSLFSSNLVGIVGAVEIPVYAPCFNIESEFAEDNLYAYYSLLDSSPSPADIIMNARDLSLSNRSIVGGAVICDFIGNPRNPHELMAEDLTVLDIYAHLRNKKWVSCLDKAMVFVKRRETGLDVVNYLIGKY